MYRSVDRYVLLCEGYVSEFYDAMGAAAEAEGKAVAIYNPAAVPDALPDISRKQRRLLFVGRLSYSDKRVDRLLQVWSRLQDEFADWSLDIVGDGEERGELERMAAELGLRRVTFCGATSDPSPWYDRASILCQTSSYEGWGMVLIEAQQHGAIPVAFDCSAGVREIVGRCGGVLVDSFDLDAYADALRRLMSSDEERARIVDVINRNRARYGIERSGRVVDAPFRYARPPLIGGLHRVGRCGQPADMQASICGRTAESGRLYVRFVLRPVCCRPRPLYLRPAGRIGRSLSSTTTIIAKF